MTVPRQSPHGWPRCTTTSDQSRRNPRAVRLPNQQSRNARRVLAMVQTRRAPVPERLVPTNPANRPPPPRHPHRVRRCTSHRTGPKPCRDLLPPWTVPRREPRHRVRQLVAQSVQSHRVLVRIEQRARNPHNAASVVTITQRRQTSRPTKTPARAGKSKIVQKGNRQSLESIGAGGGCCHMLHRPPRPARVKQVNQKNPCDIRHTRNRNRPHPQPAPPPRHRVPKTGGGGEQEEPPVPDPRQILPWCPGAPGPGALVLVAGCRITGPKLGDPRTPTHPQLDQPPKPQEHQTPTQEPQPPAPDPQPPLPPSRRPALLFSM